MGLSRASSIRSVVMLALFETPAGFALFKVTDEKKLKKLSKHLSKALTPDAVRELVDVVGFHKFENTTEAMAAATALNRSEVSKKLKSFLRKEIQKKGIEDSLAVADAKLGGAIREALGINCIATSDTNELMRLIRANADELIPGINESDMNAMVLGLAHSMSRYQIKFSPDKVDTMIVQAIGLLDDLDKELNTYAMRLKEWYGWHFPEMQKLIPDNITYANVVRVLGMRENIANVDLAEVLPEELEEEFKELAMVSMGTEISEDDLRSIHALCEQVIEMDKYRAQLFEYLKNRMVAVAPNLTLLVGELVGARLISHAGSLMNLAKHPASTVQILGAEKALFRALKTKHATPKYGLIFHASLVGQATTKNKGKMSRVLANKCALAIRVDALGDETTANVGVECRSKVENRLRELEGRDVLKTASTPAHAPPESYRHSRSAENPSVVRQSSTYSTAEDATLGVVDFDSDEETKKKKKKKRKSVSAMDVEDSDDETEKKKKKKRKREKDGVESERKRRKTSSEDSDEEDRSEKKKKKKKKKKDSE